jgi:carboxynorspermidine decarboxylase
MQSLNKIRPPVITPAFIYDEGGITENIKNIRQFISDALCRLLFPLKSFSIVDALSLIEAYVDGFSVSSLFEARLAKQILGSTKTIHLTTPGLRADEIDEISALCNFIAFNSLSQFEHLQKVAHGKASCGIRINPQLSFVKDKRYDPCRTQSKLGIPLTHVAEKLKNHSLPVKDIKGIHFHTNCESTELDQLVSTLMHIEKHLSELLRKIDWINMGGGYLFQDHNEMNRLAETLFLLRKKYDIKIYFEPGKAIVANAGYIVSTVIDLFENDGCEIAVLDTSVNHMPEVFEYQYKPTVMQEAPKGKYKYVLAGSSCLAGDVFGMYRFNAPIREGSQIIFENMGAYTLVKANMFNGMNLPNLYSYNKKGGIELKKQFSYEEYISRCGGSL